MLPAERLSALGAPLNTLRPAGEVSLRWDALALNLRDGRLNVNGRMQLLLQGMSSALSPLRPLGSYQMEFNWQGQQAQIALSSLQGPLLLSGQGVLLAGHLQFSGQAQAQAGQEEKLANLLNLLGQNRAGADKNVIALEFK